MLRQLATAIVYSNTWIASGAALLTLQTYWVAGEEVNVGLIAFVFFATVATYNFQRLLRFNKWWLRATSERLHWLIRSRRFLLVITLVSFAMAGLLAVFYLQLIHFLALIPLSAISFLYAWRFLPHRSGRRALRDIPGLKIFWIAGSWAAVTVILPLLEADNIDELWPPLFAERLFFILAITLPFDIRDMHYDSGNQKTIPQVIGIRRSAWLAQGFNVLFVGAVLVNVAYSNQQGMLMALLLTALVNAVVLAFSFRQRSEPYYSVILDGLTILQPVMVCLWLQ